MSVILKLSCFILVIVLPINASSFCPRYCQCFFRSVQCDDGDMETLDRIPDETEYMTIHDSQITFFSTKNRNLTKLKDLHISNTKIEQITITKDLVNLIELTIVENKRLNHEKIVIEAPNVGELDLRNNNLSNTPSSIPTKIETLIMSENNLIGFDSKRNFFPLLKRLHLNKNPLVEFRSADGLPSLEHLDLENTKITRFDSNQINLPNLKELILSKNNLKSINLETPMLNLTILKCNHANLTSVNTSSFNVPALKELELDVNPLSIIDFTSGLESVVHLSLKGTKLTTFNYSAASLPKLEYLILVKSPLTDFHGRYPNVITLDLSKTNLTEFNSNAVYLPKLQYLILDGTPIKRVSLVGIMREIVYLSLKNTSLIEFNTAEFQIPIIKSLFLDHTPITNINFTIGMETLKVLHMRYTALTDFTADSFNLSNLRILILDGTPIKRFRLGKSAPNLEKLSLRFTPLERFDSVWIEEAPLRSLHLGEVAVKEVDLSHQSLVYLYLIYPEEYATQIHIKNFTLPSLRQLYIKQYSIHNWNFSYDLRSLTQFICISCSLVFNSTELILPNLRDLNMRACTFKILHVSNNRLNKLEELALSYSVVPNGSEVMYLTTLRRLYLDGVRSLKNIRFQVFYGVTYLSLRGNNLTTFDTDIFHIPYLEELVLSNNSLQSIDISSYSRLAYLHLSYNDKLSNITYKKTKKPPLAELILSGDQINCSDNTWVEFFLDFPNLKLQIDRKYDACRKIPGLEIKNVSTVSATNQDYTDSTTPSTNSLGLNHTKGSDSKESENDTKCKFIFY